MTNTFINFLEGWPSELVLIILLINSLVLLCLAVKLFQKEGLYVYSILCVLCANIQVLKCSHFSLFQKEPIALGTLVFCFGVIAIQILTEYYGKKDATKCIWLGFGAMFMFTSILLVTIGFKPSLPLDNHLHMKALFTPFPGFFIASLVAYLLSQYIDIWLFLFLKKLFMGKGLLARSFLSSAFSGFIDNGIFSILAFWVFGDIPFQKVWYSYIWGTYPQRLVMILLSSMFIKSVVKISMNQKK